MRGAVLNLATASPVQGVLGGPPRRRGHLVWGVGAVCCTLGQAHTSSGRSHAGGTVTAPSSADAGAERRAHQGRQPKAMASGRHPGSRAQVLH